MKSRYCRFDRVKNRCRLHLKVLEDRATPAFIAWTGNSIGDPSFWSVGTNWAGGVPPGAGDIAVFSPGWAGGAPNMDVPFTIAGLQLNNGWGGNLTLAKTLTTTGSSQWSYGAITGGGQWHNTGALSLSGGNVVMEATSLKNSGLISHTTSGELRFDYGGSLSNESSGIYDFAGDGNINWIFGSASTIANKGLFRKSAGSLTSTVFGTVNNQGGTWESQSGTLQIRNSSGTMSGATFVAGASGTIDITGGLTSTFEGTFSGSGAGAVVIPNGIITPGAGGATFNVPTPGLLRWNGGIIRDGLFVNQGYLDIAGTPSLRNAGTLFQNYGTIRHKTTDNFLLDYDATLRIEAGGVYDLQSDGNVGWFGGQGGRPNVVNQGLIRKSGGALSSTVFCAVSSQGGTWESQSGTLRIQSDQGTHTGGTFMAGTAGAIDLTGGSAANWQGTYTGSGSGIIFQSNGTINGINGGPTFNMTTPGLFQWNGGAMRGVVTNAGFLTLNGSQPDLSFGAQLINSGTLRHVTGSPWLMDYGGSMTNTSTGVYDLQSDADLYFYGGGGMYINNAGLFRKTGGAGLSTVAGTFSNTDRVEVTSGTLNFVNSVSQYSAGTLTGGTWYVGGSSTLQLDGSGGIGTNQATVTLSGAGATFTNLNSLASNQGSLVVTGGASFSSPGTLTNSGEMTVAAGSQVNANSDYVQAGGVTIVGGNIDPVGKLDITGGVLQGSGAVLGPVNASAGSIRPGSSPGLLTFAGDFVQSGANDFRVELNGTSPGSSYDRLAVTGKVTLGGTLTATIAYPSMTTDTFVIIDNDGSDAVTDAFTSLPEGATVTMNNGATATISYKGGDGNDVALTVVTPPTSALPQIANLQVNDGSAQRSRVSSLQIAFNQLVALPVNPAGAFQLKRQSDNAIVTSSAAVINTTITTVTLTFVSGPLNFGSLADGRYSLTALASQIANGTFDGNGDGTGGDDYLLIGTPTNGLFRLFGDATGDGTVATNDFIQFRLALGGSSPIFDFDGDGAVAASDFIQFRLRFGGSV